MDKIEVKFKRLSPRAIEPKRVTEESAGLDLYAIAKQTIPTGKTALIETGWAIEIPKGYVGLIKVNSGEAIDFNITENAGVIDSDYRGHLKVAICNPTIDSPYKIVPKQKIGQLLILPCWLGQPQFVEELTETYRGEKGFGAASRT